MDPISADGLGAGNIVIDKKRYVVVVAQDLDLAANGNTFFRRHVLFPQLDQSNARLEGFFDSFIKIAALFVRHLSVRDQIEAVINGSFHFAGPPLKRL